MSAHRIRQLIRETESRLEAGSVIRKRITQEGLSTRPINSMIRSNRKLLSQLRRELAPGAAKP